MSGQENEAAQDRILTIQKSPWRAFRHLQTLGRAGGVAVFAAAFYLLYWQDAGIARQHETFFWWLALIGGAAAFLWKEYAPLRAQATQESPRGISYHLKVLGKMAGIVISSAVLDLFFFRNNPLADQYEVYVRWLTLIFAALAIWLLVQDWLKTSGMTFIFDGNRDVFRVRDKERELFQLSFQAIKRVKVRESSNLFPVYVLSVHLQDGQVIEIDSSADQEEIDGLAKRLSEMTGAPIVVQRYDEQLSAEEKEEERWQSQQIYRGD